MHAVSGPFGYLLRWRAAAAIDGRFTSGPLQGRTVNVKWYPTRDGLLDVTQSPTLDYYLVLTGPASLAQSSRGTVRPWCIESVYLFGAARLLDELRARGVKTGTASSLRAEQWAAAEIYPHPTNRLVVLTDEHASLLRQFALPKG